MSTLYIPCPLFKRLLILFISAVFALPLWSAETSHTETSLQDADSMYLNGKYLEALQLYEQIQQLDGTSVQLLFNMGNAAVKSNRYGSAMVAYQKALALDPGNSKIRNNISYLQTKIDERNNARYAKKQSSLNHFEPTGIAAFWNKITTHVNPDIWGWLALVSFGVMLAGIMCYILMLNVTVRKIGFFSAMCFLTMTIIFCLFTYSSRTHWENRRQCVITAFEAILYPKPDVNAKAEYPPLVAGTLLAVPEHEDPNEPGWVYVSLNESVTGWIKESEITNL